MAVEAKKLDVKLGDVVGIDGRRYDVVPDGAGDVTLEPAITVFADELHERRGTRPLTDQEFDELFAGRRSSPAPPRTRSSPSASCGRQAR
jgi:hypothetical protein